MDEAQKAQKEQYAAKMRVSETPRCPGIVNTENIEAKIIRAASSASVCWALHAYGHNDERDLMEEESAHHRDHQGIRGGSTHNGSDDQQSDEGHHPVDVSPPSCILVVDLVDRTDVTIEGFLDIRSSDRLALLVRFEHRLRVIREWQEGSNDPCWK